MLSILKLIKRLGIWVGLSLKRLSFFQSSLVISFVGRLLATVVSKLLVRQHVSSTTYTLAPLPYLPCQDLKATSVESGNKFFPLAVLPRIRESMADLRLHGCSMPIARNPKSSPCSIHSAVCRPEFSTPVGIVDRKLESKYHNQMWIKGIDLPATAWMHDNLSFNTSGQKLRTRLQAFLPLQICN